MGERFHCDRVGCDKEEEHPVPVVIGGLLNRRLNIKTCSGCADEIVAFAKSKK